MRGVMIVALIAVVTVVVIVVGIRALLRGRRVPTKAKLALLGALVWLISPLDPIPDAIPAIGILDDLVVIIAAVRYVLDQRTPAEPFEQRLARRDSVTPRDWRLSDDRRPPELP